MDIEVSKSLPAKLQSCAVKTDDGESITIGQLVRGQAALLLFVRHFGCIGCSENVGLLSVRFDELDKLGVRICIIGCGPHIFIQGFRERQNLL